MSVCNVCGGSGEIQRSAEEGEFRVEPCLSCRPGKKSAKYPTPEESKAALEAAIAASERSYEEKIIFKTIENNATGILHRLRQVMASDKSREDFFAEVDEMRQAEEKWAKRERDSA